MTESTQPGLPTLLCVEKFASSFQTRIRIKPSVVAQRAEGQMIGTFSEAVAAA